ncbi:hypothetical protein QUF72_03095 [Desulfobacterales bacterium HSG2]|nr:hypothetical protein [Desulfobacterales bacterium HSG2]
MLFSRKNADPYDTFKQWCLKNGFSDVINCKSREVNLRRLGEAINQYMPPHTMGHAVRQNIPLSA